MDNARTNGQTTKRFPTKKELMEGMVVDKEKLEEELYRTGLVGFKSHTAKEEAPLKDPVNHPSHYTAYKGLEIIDLTEQMNFNRGNAVKYIARAGLKDSSTELEDLEKAVWYINREINRVFPKRAG